MDIFNKLPFISLLIHEKVWLDQRKVDYSHIPEEFERKYLYKDQISIHNMRYRQKCNDNIDQMDIDVNNDATSTVKNGNTDSTFVLNGTDSTTLTRFIELDSVECYEYDPEILESPLSPDGESLGRNSKIGLDVWKWSRESSPLGYTPPLCTCKNLNLLYDNLIMIESGKYCVIEQFKTCMDENCSGLLYIPYSLIEVPLNRKLDNAMSFTNYVRIPDHTDIYCGNLKHTLVLCTINIEHEIECLEAINAAGLEHYLIYDVINRDSFIPFFTRLPNDTILLNEKESSTESKALTLLLDEGDDGHTQTAVSGQYMVTIHKLEHDKLAISKILKNQYGEFKPLDQYFFENLKRSLDALNGTTRSLDKSNENITININYNDYKILDTTTIKCNMLDSFSKERRPLNLQLRDMTTSNFDTIENILGLSANDLILSDKPIKINPQIKHHVIGNLYKLGLSAQLNKEI